MNSKLQLPPLLLGRTYIPATVAVLFTLASISACSGSDDDESSQATTGFLDDFSANSLRFTIDRRPDDSVVRDYSIEQDRIVISASSTDGERAQAYIDPWGRSDSITARLSLSNETELPIGEEARAVARVTGTFFNDTRDLGFDGLIGDVNANLALSISGNGQREAFFCVDKETADGDDGSLDLIDGSNCGGFDNFVPELDTEYTLSITLNRDAATLTFAIDDMSRSFDVGGPVFLPANDRRRVQVTHQGASGKTVAVIHAIGNDDYLQDFSTEPPVIGPYVPFFALENGDGRTLSVVDERARFEVPSPQDDDRRLQIEYLDSTDRIQSTLELASSSNIAAGESGDDKAVRLRLGGVFYNDTADGGFNDSEGNVFAAVILRSDAAEGVELEYCAYRSNTSDFSDALALIEEGGRDCGRFGIDAAYDIPYAVSVALEREAGRLVFTANGVERTHAIATGVFDPPAAQYISVQARSAGGSTAVAFVDDFGTASDAPRVAGPQGLHRDLAGVAVRNR